MDRNRDLAKGLSRIENQLAKKKYHTVTVTPVCKAGAAVDNGEVLFNPVKIPGACRTKGGAARLMSTVLVDTDDHKIAVDLWFFRVSKDLGTLGAVVDITDANLLLAQPLGNVITAVSTGVGDYVLGGVSTNTNFDLIVQSDANDNDYGDIYVAGVATGTKTYTASGIRITFGFEVQ